MNDKIARLLAQGLRDSRSELAWAQGSLKNAIEKTEKLPDVIAALEAEIAEFEAMLGADAERLLAEVSA